MTGPLRDFGVAAQGLQAMAKHPQATMGVLQMMAQAVQAIVWTPQAVARVL
jgi:hypothetical protein